MRESFYEALIMQNAGFGGGENCTLHFNRPVFSAVCQPVETSEGPNGTEVRG